MKEIVFCFVVLFSLPSSINAQTEAVDFNTRAVAPLRKFTYHQVSNFEVVNGKFNASLASSNGYLFEINSISVKQLKCGTRLTNKQFKIVLIDNSLNKTYVSTADSKGTLSIRCVSEGKYELFYIGEVFREKLKVNITATLIGSINHSRNLKTSNKAN